MVAIHTLGAGWRFCSGILYVLTWKFNGMMIHDVWLSQSDDFLHLYTYEPPTSHAAMSCSGIESGADQLSTHLQVRQILRSSLRVWVPAGTSGYQRVPAGTPGTGWCWPWIWIFPLIKAVWLGKICFILLGPPLFSIPKWVFVPTFWAGRNGLFFASQEMVKTAGSPRSTRSVLLACCLIDVP